MYSGIIFNIMDIKTIKADGRCIRTEMKLLLDLYKEESNLPYSENPVVAATANGILRSLREEIEDNAVVGSIRLFSQFGKRVYRKSLCLLLSYASSLLYPDRTLVIGHSLGDGFYFSYRDGFKPDINALKSVMEGAIREDLSIDIIRKRNDEAERYAEEHNLRETLKLLRSRNDESYEFTAIGNFMSVYYEPVLPSLRILEVWDLMDYQDGLLLRYPQSRHPMSLMDFSDNPLLFSVFRDNKRIAGNLGLESLGALNEAVSNGNINEKILLSEIAMQKRISEAADDIEKRGSIKCVFISGPSSSSKTTFSMKLALELRALGYDPIKISLDDYYLKRELIPIDKDGEKDYEVLDALNLELFRSQLNSLLKGDSVNLASFSFKEQRTEFSATPVSMNDDSILIIEGIHGLNPALVPDIDSSVIYRIYISALTQLNLDSKSRISTTDNRILRRLVRDARTRGFDAVETLSRWPSVERGEKSNIFPYQNNADIMVNSALEYELGVLSVYAVPLLKSVRKETGAPFTTARRLLEFLSLIYPISSETVPADSILREFIGGSAFNAT